MTLDIRQPTTAVVNAGAARLNPEHARYSTYLYPLS